MVTSQTLGVDLMVKSVMIPDTNTMVELFMFDCAGQSIFNQLEMGTDYVSKLFTACAWLQLTFDCCFFLFCRLCFFYTHTVGKCFSIYGCLRHRQPRFFLGRRKVASKYGM